MLRRMASNLSISSTVKLNSGYELPVLGFGVRRTFPKWRPDLELPIVYT
jgi:hypothetical protein